MESDNLDDLKESLVVSINNLFDKVYQDKNNKE